MTVDVTHQSLIFRSFYSTPFEKSPILFYGELVPVGFAHAEQLAAGLKIRLFRWQGKAVPRTYLLTAVAAIDVVAHAGDDVGRQRTAVFYCLIG